MRGGWLEYWLSGGFRKKRSARLSPSQQIGRWGENHAAIYLRRQGYRIIARNVRPDAHSEIDLIARLPDTLVFVEVKTRASEEFGAPGAAVDYAKRKILTRAAVRFFRQARNPPLNVRFDVIEVVSGDNPKRPEIRHSEDVFQISRAYLMPQNDIGLIYGDD